MERQIGQFRARLLATLLVAGVAALAVAQGGYAPPVPSGTPSADTETDVFDRSREWREDILEVIASERGRLFVVFVERSGSPKGGLMRAVAWNDPEVIAWAQEHARVVDIVLEGDRADPLQEHWRIVQNPTTIVFRDGVEVDRAVGYRGAARLLLFLRGAASGETTGVRLEKSLAGVRDGSWKAPGSERLALARDLLEASRLDDAAEQFEWLWDNLVKLDPSMERVRRGTLVMDLKDLCEQRAASRAVFVGKRDAIEATLRVDPTWELLADWLALNRALEDEDRSLAWFDRVKVHPEAPGTLERFAELLKPMLEARGGARAAEVILMYSHPERVLVREYDVYQETSRAMEAPARLAQGVAADPAAPGVAWDEGAARTVFAKQMAAYYCTLLRHDRTGHAQLFAEESRGLAIGGSLLHAFADEVMEQGLPLDGVRELLDGAKRLGQGVTESEGKLQKMIANPEAK